MAITDNLKYLKYITNKQRETLTCFLVYDSQVCKSLMSNWIKGEKQTQNCKGLFLKNKIYMKSSDMEPTVVKVHILGWP